MHEETWTPPPKNVKQSCFNEIISARGPLLTFRHKDRLWVVRAGADLRAWFMPVNKEGRGTGKWTHSRPWMDDLLRPPEIILRTRNRVLSQLRQSLKQVSRWARRPDPMAEGDSNRPEQVERADPSTLPHLMRLWPELRETLAQWERLSLTRPRRSRLAYARMRKAEQRLRRIQAVADWLGHFPPEALDFVERHGFKERRWHLLSLWLRVPEGRELFEEAPALAWMMASPWLFRKPVTQPFRSLRALVQKPRNRILEWLDLPPGDGTLKLLRMLPGSACEMLNMIHYHAAFQHKTTRGWLLNLGVPITRPILSAAVPGLVTYPILHAIAHQQRMPTYGARDWVARIYFDIRSMLGTMNRDVDQTRLGRIRSFHRLWEYHEELVAIQNRHDDQFYDSPQPQWQGRKPPPAPPAEWMQPLDTQEAVRAEARELRHCLSGYVHEIAEGRYYAYAVYHEHGRATLGLTRRAGGAWRIDQLRGLANRSVSPLVHTAVADWAQQHHIRPGTMIEEPMLLGGEAHGLHDVFEAHRQLACAVDDDIPF